MRIRTGRPNQQYSVTLMRLCRGSLFLISCALASRSIATADAYRQYDTELCRCEGPHENLYLNRGHHRHYHRDLQFDGHHQSQPQLVLDPHRTRAKYYTRYPHPHLAHTAGEDVAEAETQQIQHPQHTSQKRHSVPRVSDVESEVAIVRAWDQQRASVENPASAQKNATPSNNIVAKKNEKRKKNQQQRPNLHVNVAANQAEEQEQKQQQVRKPAKPRKKVPQNNKDSRIETNQNSEGEDLYSQQTGTTSGIWHSPNAPYPRDSYGNWVIEGVTVLPEFDRVCVYGAQAGFFGNVDENTADTTTRGADETIQRTNGYEQGLGVGRDTTRRQDQPEPERRDIPHRVSGAGVRMHGGRNRRDLAKVGEEGTGSTTSSATRARAQARSQSYAKGGKGGYGNYPSHPGSPVFKCPSLDAPPIPPITPPPNPAPVFVTLEPTGIADSEPPTPLPITEEPTSLPTSAPSVPETAPPTTSMPSVQPTSSEQPSTATNLPTIESSSSTPTEAPTPNPSTSSTSVWPSEPPTGIGTVASSTTFPSTVPSVSGTTGTSLPSASNQPAGETSSSPSLGSTASPAPSEMLIVGGTDPPTASLSPSAFSSSTSPPPSTTQSQSPSGGAGNVPTISRVPTSDSTASPSGSGSLVESLVPSASDTTSDTIIPSSSVSPSSAGSSTGSPLPTPIVASLPPSFLSSVETSSTFGPSLGSTSSPAPTPGDTAGSALVELVEGYTVEIADNGDGTATYILDYDGDAWIGFGVSPGGTMVPAQAVIALPDSGTNPQIYDLTQRSTGGVIPAEAGDQILTESSVSQEDGVTRMRFTVPLEADTPFSIAASGDTTYIWAFGSSNELGFHAARGDVRTGLEGRMDPSTEPQLSVGDQVCVEGYLMDQFCINRGTLFDNPSVETLSTQGPPAHSVHCLIDVEQCIGSPFDILLPNPNGNDFIRGWTLDDETKTSAVALARAEGICDDCDGGGTIENGFYIALTAEIRELGSDTTPPVIGAISDVTIGNPAALTCPEGSAYPQGLSWSIQELQSEQLTPEDLQKTLATGLAAKASGDNSIQSPLTCPESQSLSLEGSRIQLGTTENATLHDNFQCDQWGQGGVGNFAPTSWFTAMGDESLYEVVACSSRSDAGEKQSGEVFVPAVQILEGPSCQLMSCVPNAGARADENGCTTVQWHSVKGRRYHILVFGQAPATYGYFAIRLAEVSGNGVLEQSPVDVLVDSGLEPAHDTGSRTISSSGPDPSSRSFFFVVLFGVFAMAAWLTS